MNLVSWNSPRPGMSKWGRWPPHFMASTSSHSLLSITWSKGLADIVLLVGSSSGSALRQSRRAGLRQQEHRLERQGRQIEYEDPDPETQLLQLWDEEIQRGPT